ncbi:putative metal-dependent phosphohydrolase protein [Rhizobium phage RHph_N46]|nr:putative metal-dependent phosphohydrolase protein [Rhizobium phage RHph_N46]
MTEKHPLFWKYASQHMDAHTAQELYALYNEPHRFYHNADHIERLLFLFQTERQPDMHRDWCDTLVKAILFHDAVYYIGCKHNEEISAEYAVGKLYASGDDISLGFMRNAILATKSHTSSKWDDADLATKTLLDFDLWDIGSDWNTFYQNTVKIRAEFKDVTNEDFARGRRAFFQMLLDSPRIFREFTDREEQARANLVREYDLLAEPEFMFNLTFNSINLIESAK